MNKSFEKAEGLLLLPPLDLQCRRHVCILVRFQPCPADFSGGIVLGAFSAVTPL